VLALVVDGPHDLVLSAGWGREILVHNLSRHELRGRVRGHRHPIVALAVCGRTLVSADEGGQIGFCALHGLDALLTIDGHGGPVTALSVAAEGAIALSGSVDGRVSLWDVPNRSRRHLVECGNGPIRDLAASPDGRWCAVTGDEGMVRVLSLASGEIVGSWLMGSPTTACRWPGKAIVCGSGSGQVTILDFLQPR
jgi:WD40 repeat protein